MITNVHPKIKIVIAIIAALILSRSITGTVFLANTPRINKLFFARLKEFPGLIFYNSSNFIASLFRRAPSLTPQQATTVAEMKKLPVTALQPVTQGIYAKEDSQNNIIYVRITKETNTSFTGEKTIEVNGKMIKIYIPTQKQ